MSMDHALPLPPAEGMDPERRTWLLATTAMGAPATAAVAVTLVSSFAPTNLVVPPHKYLADGTLLIGEDDSGAA